MNGLKNGVKRLVNIITTTVSIGLLPKEGGGIEGFGEAAEEAEMSPRRVSEKAGLDEPLDSAENTDDRG